MCTCEYFLVIYIISGHQRLFDTHMYIKVLVTAAEVK